MIWLPGPTRLSKGNKTMGFTDEDRNILIGTKVEVDSIKETLKLLPCQQVPPVCNRESRLKRLEDANKRLANGFVGAIIITVVAAIGAYIRSIIP